jgi:hypothetical protein
MDMDLCQLPTHSLHQMLALSTLVEQKMNKKVTLTMVINPYITAYKQIFRLKQHKCSFHKDPGMMELKAPCA